MPFATLASLPAKNLFPGIAGHYAHTDRLTIGEVELAAGSLVPIHQHPHDQLSYILAGRASARFAAQGLAAQFSHHRCYFISILTGSGIL